MGLYCLKKWLRLSASVPERRLIPPLTIDRERSRLRLPLFRFLACSVVANVGAQTNVLTYHNDIARTGLNAGETNLTTSNVNSSTFGKLFVIPVDGKVDAQPLYVAGVTISGVKHNILYVATEHGSLYAFGADKGALLWHASLLMTGETPSDDRGCGQVTPEIGITATPVIDPTGPPNGIVFAIAMSKDSSGNYHQRLHAVDMTNGMEQLGGPMDIQASYPGSGDNTNGVDVIFDAKQYKERPGLLLNAVVYTSWSSHCDIRPYTAWVIGYDSRTLARVSVLNLTPNGSEGSVWASGAGPAADTAGNIYLLVANGTFDTTLSNGFPQNGDFGNAFVRLSATNNTLHVADYFTMFNTVSESNADEDLGSGGAMVLPDLLDSGGHTRHLAVGAGKDRNLYLVDRDNMGKFDSSSDNIYQKLPGALGGPEFAMPAYFDGKVYYGAAGASLKAFQLSSALLSPNPVSQTALQFSYPGATPSISANGAANGIVWAVENGSTAVLHAYDAQNLSMELYTSNQASNSRDHFGKSNKFITPTTANGKVYVGTPNSVAVFGLLKQQNSIVFEAESLPATSSGALHQVFTWSGFTDGKGTILNAAAIGDFVIYTLNVPVAGAYDVKVAVKNSSRRGEWQLSIDGTNQGPTEDEYASKPAWAEFDLGTVTISSPGPKSFKFMVVGKSALSTGYRIAFDYIKLTPH
jgi:hypothetical protein